MNKNIKLAVAGAVLALSSQASNAGIIIPAGDWTLDVNGNVNAFANWTKSDHASTSTVTGGVATSKDALGERDSQGINTGLLPSWLGFTGKTRQNDTDVEFTISMQPNVSSTGVTGDASPSTLFRQSYVSFGDKSWGSVKLGKDLGIFAADAILNDMTLLGVGSHNANPNSGRSTTLGGIGTGYIYAAWKGQVAYTTPNFNGFQATVGLVNPNMGHSGIGLSSVTADLYQDRFGLEGKASYSFAADNFSGKIWVSGLSQKVTWQGKAVASDTQTNGEYTASAADIGANINAGNLGVVGYYYTGEGVGTAFALANGYNTTGGKRDSDGGYVQATYKLPTSTKLGVAYGRSNLDLAAGEVASSSTVVDYNERMTVGLYHPLTKHLNLVAEWNQIQSRAHNHNKQENTTGSLGAILFF